MAIKFIDTIESLAKSQSLRDGEAEFLNEVVIAASSTFGCSRVNVWTFNDTKTTLTCLISYCAINETYESGAKFHKSDYPNYFKFLTKNELIVSNNALKEEMHQELLEFYIKPKGITSMIDVPLRSEGDIVGVICYEHTLLRHRWKEEEQKFALAIAQLLSLALETKKKRTYLEEMEVLVKQKDLLLSEINHRVKNNISIILSLINLQKSKASDDYHELLLSEIHNKVFSMAAVQEQLHLSKFVDKINMEEYLHQLANNLKNSFGGDKKVEIRWDLDPVFVDISKAIPLGLIANEIITNSYKYGFPQDNSTAILHISCLQIDQTVILKIRDNGPGISATINPGMGMEIIESLCDQIEAELEYTSTNGLETTVSFIL